MQCGVVVSKAGWPKHGNVGSGTQCPKSKLETEEKTRKDVGFQRFYGTPSQRCLSDGGLYKPPSLGDCATYFETAVNFIGGRILKEMVRMSSCLIFLR